MNKPFLSLTVLVALNFAGHSTLAADDLQPLVGKWLVKKTRQGEEYSQTITVKRDKFIFEIAGPENRLLLHAEGDVKLEKLGSFNVVRFLNIRAGRSASELQDVNDDHTGIYQLEGDTWTVAANFDKDRERQKPSVDVYQRVKTAGGPGILVIDEIEMTEAPQSATWFVCFEATVSGASQKYHVDGKGYDKNAVRIPLALEFAKAESGQKCRFKLQLDDVEDDVCTEEVDNRTTGEFTISEKGEQAFGPEDHWRYTVRWHLK